MVTWKHYRGAGLILGIFLLLALGLFILGCSSSATATPAPTKAPAPAATPTAVPAAVATPTRAPTATVLASNQPVRGGTLRATSTLEIDTLDPAYNTLSGAFTTMASLYSPLIRLDEQFQLIPWVASSWDISPDGKAITINIRNGVKFQDGTAFNSQAVKWNYDRILDPNSGSPRRGELEPYLQSLDIVNDTTLILRLKTPFRPFLPVLASDRLGWLVSPAAVQKHGGGKGGNYGRNPVGTGPFQFVEWVPGQRIVLKRSESYWDQGKPYLDGINVIAALEPDVAIAMLRTGEVDVLHRTNVRNEQDVARIKSNPDLRVNTIKGAGGTFFMHFNPSKPPFDNKALRQAISYSIDRQRVVDSVLGGGGTPAHSLIAVGWAHNPDVKPIAFDLAKAKAKLTEAGFPKGVTLPLGSSSGVYGLVSETVQAMAKEAGITLELRTLQYTGYFAMDQFGYFNGIGLGSTSWFIRPDPHTLLFILAHSKGFNNVGAYVNPEVDRLIDEAATTYDTAKAKPMYDKIQSMIADDASMAFLAWANLHWATSKRVQGFVPPATPFEYMGSVWLER